MRVNSPDYIVQPEKRPSLFLNVPTMPLNFVGRDELMADLVQQVVGGQTLALAAEGLPGVGKTTLAVALAHHAGVLAHFTDGVLWGGLGRTPDVMGILADWAAALGGDVTAYAEDGERSRAVRNLIGQRRLLLVMGDGGGGTAALRWATLLPCVDDAEQGDWPPVCGERPDADGANSDAGGSLGAAARDGRGRLCDRPGDSQTANG